MEGLSQLLILLIFAAIAFLEGAGRRRKAGPPRPRPPAQPVPRPAPRARREVDASRRPSSPPGEPVEAEPRTSEGVLPEELWEELLGLPPRRKTPPVEVGAPQGEDSRGETVEGKEEIPPFEARSLEEEPLAPEEVGKGGGKPERRPEVADVVPWTRSDALTGAPPVSLEETPRRMLGSTALSGVRSASPAPSPSVGAGPERDSPRARLFGAGRGADLRRAVLLREVLGPPLALREEAEGQGFPRG